MKLTANENLKSAILQKHRLPWQLHVLVTVSHSRQGCASTSIKMAL